MNTLTTSLKQSVALALSLLVAAQSFAFGPSGSLSNPLSHPEPELGPVKATLDGGSDAVRPLGRVGGTTHHRDQVEAQMTDVYRITFVRGESAVVRVIGDGDTDLDLYVYDENGRLVAEDSDSTDYCVVSWTPRWTGTFTVKIVNLGRVYNAYTLTTN